MRGVLLIVGVIAVAAVVVLAGVFTTTLPDENVPGANSIGYVDLTVHATMDLDYGKLDASLGCNDPNAFCPIAPVGIRLQGDEHITSSPQSPASFFALPKLTGGGTFCKGVVRATVAGPGFGAPVVAESDTVDFILGDVVAYRFGHLYINERGEFTVKMEFVVDECYTYNSNIVFTLSKPLTFDGVSDN